MKTLNNEQYTVFKEMLNEKIRLSAQSVRGQEKTHRECESRLALAQYENDSTSLKFTNSDEKMQKLNDHVNSSFEFLELQKSELNKYERLKKELFL